MNRRKGHNYLTVFVDLEARRVLLAVEGKDASVWERFAEQLLKHNGHPKAITRVAIDMSPAYKRGVRENLGNAVVTFDKFHVVSLVAAALEKVRRKEVSQSAQAREELAKTAWLFRKNPEDWTETEEQRWEQLKDKPLVTGLAYAMRLEFQEIYKAGSAKEAKSKLGGLVPMGEDGGQQDGRRFAGTNAAGSADCARPYPRNIGTLGRRINHGVSGRIKQLVLCDKKKSSRG